MKIPGRVRYFNKLLLNRLIGKIARSSRGPFCIIYHVGRRSGKAYETPIIAIPTVSGFVVALTYGPAVDWFRNITAVGKCRLLWHKKEYAIEHIEPVDRRIALPYFSRFERRILQWVGIQDFIRLEV